MARLPIILETKRAREPVSGLFRDNGEHKHTNSHHKLKQLEKYNITSQTGLQKSYNIHQLHIA